MSKALEAYRRLCRHLDYDNDDYMFNGCYEEDNEVIENALKDYEILKKDLTKEVLKMNSKEALERLYDGYQNGMAGRSFYDIIKQDLEILEIIKTKKVDISLIKNCYGLLAYAVYNSHIDEEKNDELTKQEFNKIKEWLENDK